MDGMVFSYDHTLLYDVPVVLPHVNNALRAKHAGVWVWVCVCVCVCGGGGYIKLFVKYIV